VPNFGICDGVHFRDLLGLKLVLPAAGLSAAAALRLTPRGLAKAAGNISDRGA
jgi:hypothetical protein